MSRVSAELVGNTGVLSFFPDSSTIPSIVWRAALPQSGKSVPY